MAAEGKKSRKNAGKARKQGSNVVRVTYRTELKRKLRNVYRSSGREAGDAYCDRLMSTDPMSGETHEQTMRRYAQSDRYRAIRDKERKRIADRKDAKVLGSA